MIRPNSRRNLDIAIERLSDGSEDAVRARRLLANAIVGQFLPDGAVKGGSALKLRYGTTATRFSKDLDAARASNIESYTSALEDNLRVGWNGFTGRLVKGKQAKPKEVPQIYVMQPFEVKLSYNGKSWTTVPLEVGHNEIGDADDPDMIVPAEVNRMLESLGFPELKPIPIMKLSHQVAQKLHGLTGKGSTRVHDLVDLQIIMHGSSIDLSETRAICERLFAYRKQQAWPSRVEVLPEWETGYAAAAEGMPVPKLEDAVCWANAFIERIASA